MTLLPTLKSEGRLERADRPALAWRHCAPASDAVPTIVFLPGYASDMSGSKACAVYDWAARTGTGCLLFDYAGCGQSGGSFEDETLESWADDALAIIGAQAAGPLVLIGSSMGGWLMLLVARALGVRVRGLIGIAPAPDFTEWGMTDQQRAILLAEGRLLEDNPYGPEPTVTTRAFWESGQRHLQLGGPIPITCPVRLLHGQADPDVPFAISLKLAERLASTDVRVTLIKDGDHRLSRDEDIGLLIATCHHVCAGAA